jgi:hypothetical protein
MEKDRFPAHIPGMEKREKWTVCRGAGGNFAVAQRLPDGRAGDALIVLPTVNDAWQFIDSGRADDLARKWRK